MDVLYRIQQAGNHIVQRNRVTFQVCLEPEAFSGGENGDAVRADRSAAYHHVAGLCPVRGNADTFAYDTDTACIDEQFVAFAPFHHFRIASHDLHASPFGSRFHRPDDASEVRQRKPFFQYKPSCQVKRTGATAGKVIHCPVHGQIADIPAGKEDRVYYEGIG